MKPMSAWTHRRLLPVAATALAVGLILGGCSSGDDTVAVPEDASTVPGASRGAASEAYCTTASEVASQPGGLDLSTGAPSAIDGIEQLAADAPDSLQGDFDTFLEGARSIADLDQDDPDALAAIFALITDPDFAAAADAIESYTGSECGVELGASSGSGSTGTDEDGDAGRRPGEIQLEDIDAVKESNDGAGWSEKLSTTVVNGLADVQVSSGDDDLSQDEAMAACDALVTVLSERNTDVTVSVASGQDVLAKGADGTCAEA